MQENVGVSTKLTHKVWNLTSTGRGKVINWQEP